MRTAKLIQLDRKRQIQKSPHRRRGTTETVALDPADEIALCILELTGGRFDFRTSAEISKKRNQQTFDESSVVFGKIISFGDNTRLD